ncbi:MAG: cysteine desulfurase family protein [Clostridia bacterium]
MIKASDYFDNCATTKTDDDVAKLMDYTNRENYFNPSSLNDSSVSVYNDISAARATLINKINGSNGDIIFTSCGSEADNLAILGSIKNNMKLNIVTSNVEHPAVFNTINSFKSKGFEIRYAKVNKDGSVEKESVCNLIDENTALVSIMHVNNETGAINNIKDICKNVKAINKNTLFMSDGVQAFTKIPVNVNELCVDLYSLSAHKIHSAKGNGALWIKRNTRINPMIYGGGQEQGIRNGTENVAGILAFALAAEKSMDIMESNTQHYATYKEILNTKLQKLDDYKLLCKDGSPNIYSVVFKNVKGEVIMHMLDNDDKIIVGIGSSCSSKHRTNRIAEAIELEKSYQDGLIRISFCKYNTIESVEHLGDCLVKAVKSFRGIK